MSIIFNSLAMLLRYRAKKTSRLIALTALGVILGASALLGAGDAN